MKILSSEECGKSELDLFYVPPTQIGIEEGSWDDVLPESNFNRGTITFSIPGDSFHYINLSQTELYIKVHLKTGGNDINFKEATAPKIGPINNFFHSLFSQIEIKFNSTLVENTNSSYPYRAYLENLLSYTKESKNTFLRSELFIKDDPDYIGSNLTSKPAADNKYNSALEKRRNIFINQPVELRGRLHCDIFNLNKYLLSNINITIKLSRTKSRFYLIGEHNTDNVYAEISDCFLRVRRAKINDTVMHRHALELEKTTAKYPIKRVLVNIHMLTASSKKAQVTNIHTGVLPNRVVIGFVDTLDCDGDLQTNPYNFKHYDITSLKLKASSKNIPYTEGLKMDFENNAYQQAYNTLFQGLTESPCDISYDDYKKGYALYVFDLTPDLCSSEHFNLLRDGQLDLEIESSKQLSKDISVVVYLEFDNIIEITKHRNIITDYVITAPTLGKMSLV